MFASPFLRFLPTIGSSSGLASASRNLGGMKLAFAGAILADDGRDSFLFWFQGQMIPKLSETLCFGSWRFLDFFRDVQLCSLKPSY